MFGPAGPLGPTGPDLIGPTGPTSEVTGPAGPGNEGGPIFLSGSVVLTLEDNTVEQLIFELVNGNFVIMSGYKVTVETGEAPAVIAAASIPTGEPGEFVLGFGFNAKVAYTNLSCTIYYQYIPLDP